MERTELMGRPAPLFSIPGEGEEAPWRMHTRAYLVQRHPSLCQDLLLWHNYAIASPFESRALLPWCGLTIGLIQGQGKVKIAHLQVLNLASFWGHFWFGEVSCLEFILRDPNGNLSLSLLFAIISYEPERSFVQSFTSPPGRRLVRNIQRCLTFIWTFITSYQSKIEGCHDYEWIPYKRTQKDW